jgi:mRNA interferase RelE/StbE
MPYSIEFRPSAARDLKKLEKAFQRRILGALSQLENNPFPPGTKKLINQDNVYRIRVGDFRILYQVELGRLLILVLRVGHRREVYR